jgi:hypothetical protein
VSDEDVCQTELVPHLPEPRVGVEENPVAGSSEQLSVGAEAHNVQQQVGAPDPRQRVAPRETGMPAVVVRDRPREVEAVERAPDVLDKRRFGSGQPVDEQDFVSEPAEAEQVLKKLPGVAWLAGLLCDSSADDDAAGRHFSCQTAQSASACRSLYRRRRCSAKAG